MWPTRSAAVQPGQPGTGRDQPACAAASRSRPFAAVTISGPGSCIPVPGGGEQPVVVLSARAAG